MHFPLRVELNLFSLKFIVVYGIYLCPTVGLEQYLGLRLQPNGRWLLAKLFYVIGNEEVIYHFHFRFQNIF